MACVSVCRDRLELRGPDNYLRGMWHTGQGSPHGMSDVGVTRSSSFSPLKVRRFCRQLQGVNSARTCILGKGKKKRGGGG